LGVPLKLEYCKNLPTYIEAGAFDPMILGMITLGISRNTAITIYEGGIVIPQSKQGVSVEGLPEEVKLAYEEARKCFSVSAFTSCELICRKILMHVACHKGDSEGKKFVEYIDYLKIQGYITRPMEGWVGIIRQHGNDTIHELKAPEKERAESTLMFTGHLLKSIYEMENLSSKYTKSSPSPAS
jgi:hypothetical protein